MNNELLTALRKSFASEDIKHREGRGRMTFSYVPIGEVIQRILDSAKGDYSWEVVRMDYMPVPPTRQGAPEFMWMCHGRITIEGRTYDGIGTHPATDEESPKSAESDAYKRCAVKVGVALNLYTDPHDNGTVQTRSQGQGEPTKRILGGNLVDVWGGPGQCPSCHAPMGKPHGKQCQGVPA